jgi:D-alanyl-D-alanine carboxypeptidase
LSWTFPVRLNLTAKADLIASQMISVDGPGAAILIVAGGEVLLQAGYGLADVEARVQVMPHTAFDLASVSKQFTAVAVLLLAERGQLAIDGMVADYLPEWSGYGTGRPLRLTDLLCHTSGLPDYSSIWRGAVEDAGLGNAEYLQLLWQHAPVFPAGTKADYSNSNYILLAAIIERVTGQTLSRFLHEEIFTPLAMTGSRVQDDPTRPLPARARGYKRDETGQVEASDIPIRLVGHSHLFSTVADLGRWYQALWGHRVLSPASLSRALTLGCLDGGERHGYGFGWYDDSAPGRRSVGHGGCWYGFRNYVRRCLEADLTVAVLSNDENYDAEGLVNRLVNAVLAGLEDENNMNDSERESREWLKPMAS